MIQSAQQQIGHRQHFTSLTCGEKEGRAKKMCLASNLNGVCGFKYVMHMCLLWFY